MENKLPMLVLKFQVLPAISYLLLMKRLFATYNLVQPQLELQEDFLEDKEHYIPDIILNPIVSEMLNNLEMP